MGNFVGKAILYGCQLTFLFFACEETEQVVCCLLEQHVIVSLVCAIWIMVVSQLPQSVDYTKTKYSVDVSIQSFVASHPEAMHLRSA